MHGQRRSRRSVLAITAAGVAGLAGCVSFPFGGGGPQERAFEITLRESDNGIAASIEPAGDVEDVIQVTAGDDVTFDFHNERDHPTGVHNHVTDEEAVIEPGSTHTMTFSPTEEMIGRYDVEAFDAGHAGDDGHGEDTTTGEHHEEGSSDEDHEEDDHGDHEGDSHGDHEEGNHGGQEGFVIVAVEVRPSGS